MLQKLSLEQGNELRLSAELLQGIQVFAMSAPELTSYIQSTVQENPFLRIDETPFEMAEQPGSDKSAANPPLDYGSVDALAACTMKKKPFSSHGEAKQIKEYPFERYFVQKCSLESHLEDQIRWDLQHDAEWEIACYLIENIDSDGYLLVSVEEAARVFRVPPEQVVKILSLLQTCQPAGIAARTLQECLKIQLTVQGEDTELSFAMVENHLEDIATGRLPKIAAHLGAGIEEVQQAADAIRKLNPRPGSVFGEVPDETIIPELDLKAVDGGFSIELLDAGIPGLALERSYLDLMEKASVNRGTKKYLDEHLKAAKALMGSVDRRRSTLLSIATCLAEMQPEFLLKGPAHMRPLTMNEVAVHIGMSEATVSRMVNGNYIRCPSGIFELRAFFSSAVGESEDFVGVSSARIKQMIGRMVDEEDKKHPLSDAGLAERLAAEGIAVSRRAVTKYRNALGIPGSAARQRY